MMRINNYYCLGNDACSLKGKTQQFEKDSTEDPTEYCPECGNELKFIGVEMAGGYMKFASADDKGKKAIIKKRARKHYEKFEQKDVENKKLQVQNDIRRQVGAAPLKRLQ